MLEILRVGLQQAIRSIILLLLPISFMALVVWATSGSSTGNTADPIRAALWSILVAHQVPLQLNSSYLTFLPLGALFIPYIAVKSGIQRMVGILGAIGTRDRRGYILTFSISYSLILYLISIPALNRTVSSPFYITIPIIFLVSTFFAYLTSGISPRNATQFPWQRSLRATVIAFSALVGVSFLVFAGSLIWHFDTVLTVTRVVEPGIFGGIMLALIQLFYLPNIAIATLSYLIGSGFEIGINSYISPISYQIDELPAIPLLGAIPTSSIPIFLLAIALPVVAGALITRYGVESYSRPERDRYLYSALAFVLLISLLLARLSSGELLSSNLKSTGPIWWAMPIAITAQIGLGGALYLLTPRLISSIRQLQSRHGETS
ncbi:MAG: hypothetical protein FJW46_04940 [Actinobacteria bacterium]|nr:hypothetical protein [Actinomycetota bacterium]